MDGRREDSKDAGDAGRDGRGGRDDDALEGEVLPAPRPPLAIEGRNQRVRVEVDEAGHGRFARGPTRPRSPQAGAGMARVGSGGCSMAVSRTLLRIGVVGAVVVGFMWMVGDGVGGVDGAIAWLRASGWQGRLAIVSLCMAVTPIFVPNGLLAIGPGYLWGPVEGTLWVVVGATLGGLVNVALARRVFGERVAAFIAGNPFLAVVADSIDRRGFRIILGLRLSPVVPFSLLAYLAGLTRISALHFGIAAFVGGIPWTAVYATAGSVLAASSATPDLGSAELGPYAPLLRWVGLGVTVAIALWVGGVARRDLAAMRSRMGDGLPGASSDAGSGSGSGSGTESQGDADGGDGIVQSREF